MIKKLHLLLALGLGLITSASVSAQQVTETAPELKWLSVQDGTGLEIGIEITESADGNALILNRFQSSGQESEDPDFGGKIRSLNTDYWFLDKVTGEKVSEKTSIGHADVISANGGENMTLYKVGKDGHLIWGIYSTLGDFAGAGTMAATPDNGVMMILKMRAASKATISPDTLLQITDAKDKITTVTWKAPAYDTYGWVYQPVIVKVNGEGEVEWAKKFDVEYFSAEEKGTSQNWSNTFDVRSMVADENGNVFAAGRTNTNIDFGNNVKLTDPRNVAGWNGDSQTTRGDLFVVKFNAKGEAQWVTTSAGDPVECEAPQSIAYANKTLYISGYMKGDNTNAALLGTHKIIPGNYKSLFAASLSAEDGQFNWAKMYNSTTAPKVSKPYAKPMSITVDGNDIFMGGSFTGNIIDGNDESKILITNGIKALTSYVIKCSANDGSFVSAIDPTKKIISEIQAVHVKGNRVIASGYHLNSSSFTYIMDRDLSESSLQKFSVKDCNMGTTQGSVLIGDDLISLTRGKNTVSIPGVDWQYNAVQSGGMSQNDWCVLFLCHSLKDYFPVGIEDTKMGNNSLKVSGAAGQLMIEASEVCKVRIYNMIGVMIFNETISEGTTTVNLPKGIYIVNGKKVMVF